MMSYGTLFLLNILVTQVIVQGQLKPKICERISSFVEFLFKVSDHGERLRQMRCGKAVSKSVWMNQN